MKIIQLIYSLSAGGAERFVVTLSNQLASIGHDVTICTLLLADNEQLIFNKQYMHNTVKFHSMEFKPGFSINKVRKLERYIISQNPDVVHCHLNVLPYIYRISFKNTHIKFIHTLHSVAENTVAKYGQKYVNYFFYKRELIKPIAISKECLHSFENYYKLNNALCINNGCEIPLKTYKFEDVLNEINSYKTSQETRVFIHVARYHDLKNQGLLIQSFNKLDSLGKDFILLIIGDGFASGDGLKLQKSANSKIHFLGLKNNVADYLYCSDAYCLTSKYEGLPISLLEALGAGVTPICTSVGGISDVISDSINGYLSNDLTVDSYLETLTRYYASPQSIERRSLIDFFDSYCSIKVCAKHYIAAYEDK